jgi:exopolysaccharide production protein ExoQ
MMPLIALFACLSGVVWLLSRDVKERPDVSPAAWVVVTWVGIYASRPVTSWFADPSALTSPQSFDESNPGEALIILALIVAATIVLVRRRVQLREVIGANTWLAVVYLFWLQSVLWSDDPIITFKRLFKDVGNIAMVLVVLTDRNVAETIRAVCVRCAYVCIPLSVMLIRYYPNFGRSYIGYNQDQVSFVGVTENKNTLGMLALISVIVLLWDLLERYRTLRGGTEYLTAGARVFVLLTGWYLLRIADSATSLVCAAFGSVMLVVLGLSPLKRRPARVEVWGVGALLLAWTLTYGLGLHKVFVESLGRDTSLTTRTDMWPILLRLQDSPLVGAGFSTFWSGRRLVQVEQALGGLVIQAHNGYLDTYLNGGLVALGLLVVLLGLSYRRVRERLALGTPDARLRFTILFVAIVHNFTEATFFKLSLLWFVTVFALMDYRAAAASDGLEETMGRRVEVMSA